MTAVISDSVLADIRDEIGELLRGVDESFEMGYYAVAGSHLHGTATEASDIDVRGFHCTPPCAYDRIQQPSPRLEMGFEQSTVDGAVSVEVVSHELRSFGVRLSKQHFNAVEPLYAGDVIEELPGDLRGWVQSAVEASLPGQLPVRYQGMAESLYSDVVARGEEEGVVSRKEVLYAVRGALAARYVDRTGAVEPKLFTLVGVEGDEELEAVVEAVVDMSPESSGAGAVEWARVESVLAPLMGWEPLGPDEGSRRALVSELDEWMADVREARHE